MHLSKRDNGIWYIWYTNENSDRLKKSTGERKKSVALKFLREFKKQQSQPSKRHKKMPTFDQFYVEFMMFSRTSHTKATQAHFQTAYREYVRLMGTPRSDPISSRDIETFLRSKIIETSAWTARKYHISLSSVLQKAFEWGYLEENPFRCVKRPTPPQRTPSFFSEKELRTVLSSIEDPQLIVIVKVAVLAGMYLGELLALRWDSVDMNRGEIHVQSTSDFTTKSKRNRTIPMNKALRQVLSDWECQSEPRSSYKMEVTDGR